MDYQKYKVKVEYGVSAVVMLVGVFFIIQAFTIDTTREVGPRTLPMILAVSMMGGPVSCRAMGKAGDLRDGYGFLKATKRIFCHRLWRYLFYILGLGYFVALSLLLQRC